MDVRDDRHAQPASGGLAAQSAADDSRRVGACTHAPSHGGCKHPPYERAAADGERQYGLLSLAAVLAAVFFAFPLVLDIPLLDPTEGLHASIVQEMVQRDQWVVPQLFGEPFLDKPVLHFWTQAMSLSVFGMHEPAIRLPGMLFGLLAAMATGLMAGRMFGKQAGLIAGILYTTMILPTALVQFPTSDVTMIPCVIVAIWLFWEADRATQPRGRVLLTLGIGIALGLACLSKGVVGIAVVGVAYGGYLLLAQRLTPAACLRGIGALAIAALIASAWFLAVENRVPGYLHYYFIERTLLGYATDSQIHGGEPWWYYLPILLGGGLPWIGYLPAVMIEGYQRRRIARASGDHARRAADPSPMLLMACWLVGGTLLFSAAGSKLITYIWPVLPPIAVLAAVAWSRLLDGTLTEPAQRNMVHTLRFSSLTGPLLVPGVLLGVGWQLEFHFSPVVWTVAVVVAAASLLPGWFIRRETRLRSAAGVGQAALIAATLAVAVQFGFLMSTVVPRVAERHSARGLAEYLNRRDVAPGKLLIAEQRIGSLVFYLDRSVRERLGDDRLRRVHVASLPELEPETIIVVPEAELDRVRPHVRLEGKPYRRVDRYRLYDGAAFVDHPVPGPDKLARLDRPR